jgi:hypothetical protein
MAKPRKRSWRNTLISTAVLAPIIGVVVYSSFQLSDYECEICMDFEGLQICRTVTGKTEVEAVRTGIDNACAHLASGVTDSMRCQRTPPKSVECRPI